MRMGWKPPARGNAVLVDHPQRSEAHVLRVVIAAKGKTVLAVEPAEVGRPALFRFPDVFHDSTALVELAPYVFSTLVDTIALINPHLSPNGIQSMDKLGAMNAFAKVVALGSFAEAARTLGTTRSAASKAVMELEHVLGVRLLDRTTRRVRTTEAGLAYYERCVDILARVEETEMQVARLHGEPIGRAKVNGPASFGALYLAPAVSEFMAAYPKIKIELTLTDRFIDPIEEGADVTIRIAELADLSLIARKLAPARRAFVASPSYVARQGEPMAPEDLARHACLTYGHTTTLQRWRVVRDGEAAIVPVDSVLCSNSGDVLRAAALAGRALRFCRHSWSARTSRAGGFARLSSTASRNRARRPRPLCVEPLSRCQDPGVHRLPRQTLRRRAGMGPLPTSETPFDPPSVHRRRETAELLRQCCSCPPPDPELMRRSHTCRKRIAALRLSLDHASRC